MVMSTVLVGVRSYDAKSSKTSGSALAAHPRSGAHTFRPETSVSCEGPVRPERKIRRETTARIAAQDRYPSSARQPTTRRWRALHPRISRDLPALRRADHDVEGVPPASHAGLIHVDPSAKGLRDRVPRMRTADFVR